MLALKKYISLEKYKSLPLNKEKRSKIFWYFIAFFIFLVLFFAFLKIINWHKDNAQIKKLNKELASHITINEEKYQIDFSKLLSQNKDTVGFLHLNNSIINYPIVQAKDNQYYLNHSFDNKKNDAGWLFLDYRNSLNNLSDNLIIYGHSRIDGTMFGSLRNILKSSWQEDKENYVIYFSSLKEEMLFQIFSLYIIESESYYLTVNFQDAKEKQQWIKIVQKRNIAPIKEVVTLDDKFLTLSTCYDNKGKRLVVHAKLIKKEKIS